MDTAKAPLAALVKARPAVHNLDIPSRAELYATATAVAAVVDYIALIRLVVHRQRLQPLKDCREHPKGQRRIGLQQFAAGNLGDNPLQVLLDVLLGQLGQLVLDIKQRQVVVDHQNRLGVVDALALPGGQPLQVLHRRPGPVAICAYGKAVFGLPPGILDKPPHHLGQTKAINRKDDTKQIAAGLQTRHINRLWDCHQLVAGLPGNGLGHGQAVPGGREVIDCHKSSLPHTPGAAKGQAIDRARLAGRRPHQSGIHIIRF